MGSKKLYEERKAAGLCTKCGDLLGESISTTRCAPCYEKFRKNGKVKELEIKSQGLCLRCKLNSPSGNSNYCNECRQKNAELKRISEPQEISKFNETFTACRVCNSKIDTIGIICKNCLSDSNFSKIDAISRYAKKCSKCPEEDISQLKIVTSDIEKKAEHHGAALYKVICFNTNPPKDYRVLCYKCYWQENLIYINGLRNFFEKTPTTDEDFIDIDYEEPEDEIV